MFCALIWQYYLIPVCRWNNLRLPQRIGEPGTCHQALWPE